MKPAVISTADSNLVVGQMKHSAGVDYNAIANASERGFVETGGALGKP